MMGATIWQGPHQVALKSRTTGWSPAMSVSKFWLLISNAIIVSFLIGETNIITYYLAVISMPY